MRGLDVGGGAAVLTTGRAHAEAEGGDVGCSERGSCLAVTGCPMWAVAGKWALGFGFFYILVQFMDGPTKNSPRFLGAKPSQGTRTRRAR